MHFLVGAESPAWAGEVTGTLVAALPGADVTLVPGHGHDMVDTAPALVVDAVAAFLA